jgi:glycosyltransferase involved in cell wall biosynthesis
VLLEDGGFSRVDPSVVSATLDGYRDYIRGSWAELMVAKEMYVASRSGWFSERSACYLASGRPVLAQDTGLDGLLPAGEGLVTFADLDEAVAAVEAIAGDWQRHARAARDLAEEYFDSDIVLGRLLDVVGAAGPVAA